MEVVRAEGIKEMTPAAKSQALMLQLRQRAKSKGIEQQQIAKRISRSNSMVSQWLTGGASPALFNAIALAQACGMRLVLAEDPDWVDPSATGGDGA